MKTKIVPVWHVEWGHKAAIGPRHGHMAGLNLVWSYEAAAATAKALKLEGATCINITGPHQHRVPEAPPYTRPKKDWP